MCVGLVSVGEFADADLSLTLRVAPDRGDPQSFQPSSCRGSHCSSHLRPRTYLFPLLTANDYRDEKFIRHALIQLLR